MTDNTIIASIAQGLRWVFYSRLVREAIDDIPRSDWEEDHPGSWHRTNPFPMGFYPHDRNIYYARGWGCHQYAAPWERRALSKAIAKAFKS